MDAFETELIDQAIGQLAGMGLRAVVKDRKLTAKQGPKHDARIRLGHGDNDEIRLVEVKRYVTPATLGAVQAQLKALDDKPLLITHFVTPPMAERLRHFDIEFADAAGNAYIKLENALIWVCGRRRQDARPGNWPTGRAFEPSGLRVVFALLCNPQYIEMPYRDLGQVAGVAHGTVGWVMADLAARGFLPQRGDRHQHRTLIRAKQLAQQWIEAYALKLRPTLLLARYRAKNLLELLNRLKLAPGVVLGGELAAARLTGYLKPATATFWVDKVDPKFILANHLTLDHNGDIEFMRRFWNFETPTGDRAPDLLTYADLLAMGDARTVETARRIEGAVLDRFVG